MSRAAERGKIQPEHAERARSEMKSSTWAEALCGLSEITMGKEQTTMCSANNRLAREEGCVSNASIAVWLLLCQKCYRTNSLCLPSASLAALWLTLVKGAELL